VSCCIRDIFEKIDLYIRDNLYKNGLMQFPHSEKLRVIDVLPLDIVSSESFTRHELPAFLAAHFVDDHMKKVLSGSQTPEYFYIDGFLSGWFSDR
jgi:hypothetical protein